MPTWRDAVWAVLVCFAITFMVQCRPAWEARRFIQRESQEGFYEAYSGHRFVSGEVISSGGGVHADPMASTVSDRRLVIQAERIGWTGNKAEFVVRHRIELADGDGIAASQDVHVQIKRDGKSWVYTLFEVRGRGPLHEPNAGNPWARALNAAKRGSARPKPDEPDEG
jgi:hypothetical protein